MNRRAPMIWTAMVVYGCGGSAQHEHHGNGDEESHAEHAHEEPEDDHDHERHAEHDGHDEHAEDDHGHGEAEADHGGSEGERVVISEAAINRNGIEIAEVETRVVHGGVELAAEVTLDPERTAHVTSLLAGQLAEVHVSVGDSVEAGEPLALLRSAELGEARAARVEAETNLATARAQLTRKATLTTAGIAAEHEHLEAEADVRRAEAELSAVSARLGAWGAGGRSGATTVLRSPIRGKILDRHATVGEFIQPDARLFVIADLDRVWVVGRAHQRDVVEVQPSAPARLTLPGLDGRVFDGHVDYVAPALDEATRTVLVRVPFENPDGLLRPGLFGELTVGRPGDGGRRAAMVHRDAVQELSGRDVVFIAEDELGAFHAQPVELGSADGEWVEVARGVVPGTRYVRSGGFVLKSELLRAELGHGHAH